MIGNGDLVTCRGEGCLSRASKLDVGEDFRLVCCVGIKERQHFTTRGVTDGDQAFAVVQPFQKTIAHAIALSMLAHSTFPVAHRKCLAACGKRNRVSLWMERDSIKIAYGGNKATIE